MKRNSIQKYHTIFSIDEGQIDEFFQVYDTFQYLLPLVEHQPTENVEWRMVFNTWLFFSTENIKLQICPSKSNAYHPTSALFEELLKRPLMQDCKEEVTYSERYGYIAAMTIAMEVLAWYKQSIHIKKDEFQMISMLLTNYTTGIQKGQEYMLVKMSSDLVEKMTSSVNLSLELDYCLMNAMQKAKKLDKLFYEQEEMYYGKELYYSKLC